jgi:hypothetical protein
MAWIEPLSLSTWLVNVLSGDLYIFTAIALIFIVALAAYFRMSMLVMVSMIGLFVIMFLDYVDNAIFFLLIAIVSISIAIVVRRVVTRN